MTDEERAKRVEEIRQEAKTRWPPNAGTVVGDLLAELDRVTAERDKLKASFMCTGHRPVYLEDRMLWECARCFRVTTAMEAEAVAVAANPRIWKAAAERDAALQRAEEAEAEAAECLAFLRAQEDWEWFWSEGWVHSEESVKSQAKGNAIRLQNFLKETGHAKSFLEERDAALAQVATLRLALEQATHQSGCHPSEGVHSEWCVAARAALAATAPKEGER